MSRAELLNYVSRGIPFDGEMPPQLGSPSLIAGWQIDHSRYPTSPSGARMRLYEWVTGTLQNIENFRPGLQRAAFLFPSVNVARGTISIQANNIEFGERAIPESIPSDTRAVRWDNGPYSVEIIAGDGSAPGRRRLCFLMKLPDLGVLSVFSPGVYLVPPGPPVFRLVCGEFRNGIDEAASIVDDVGGTVTTYTLSW